MAKQLAIYNKPCTFSAEFKGSKMRSADGEGDKDGDAGKFEPGRQHKVKGVKVTELFATELSQNPLIWRFLFDFGPEGKIKGPASTRVGKIPIKEKFKNCRSTITWGISNKLDVTNARVSGIYLYADGSDCYMDFTHQGIYPISKLTMELEAHEGEVKISVRFGPVEESDDKDAPKQADLVDEQNDSEASEEPAAARPAPGMPTGVTH